MTGTINIVTAPAPPLASLYLPAIYNGFFGGYITGENIVNPNSTPVTVTLTYYTASNGMAIPTSPFVIGSHSLVSLSRASSGAGLPNGGQLTNFNGAVTITATNGVVAVVTVTGGPDNSLIVTANAISSNFFYTYTEQNGSNSPVAPSIKGSGRLIK
jgi:hypothetical protein